MSVLGHIKQRNKTDLWAGISLVGALCFMLFFYAPLELFFYNQRDFWFDVYTLIPLILLIFGVSFLVMATIMTVCFFVCPRLYHIVVPAVGVVFLCSYVQGNFLVGNLPPMDGSAYDWADYSQGRIPSVILWGVVICLIIVVWKLFPREKCYKVTKLVSIFMILMLSLTIVSVCITTKGYRKNLNAVVTTRNEFVYSEDTNFIVLVIDAADSQTFYEMLEESPEYQELFTDFTYYHNMLGAYPCTSSAVPQLLSGEWFENQIDFDEYRVNAFKDSSFLEELEQRGYRLGMYEDEIPFRDQSVYRFENVTEKRSKVSSYWNLAKLEIKLTGLRYAPFDLKRFCSFKMVEFQTTQEVEADYPAYPTGKALFYQRMQEEDITVVPDKCFRFMHIDGAHVPFELDKNLNPVENGSYRDVMEASLTVTEEYLKKLKYAGVYDNSVIIVMADHGLDSDDPAEYTGRQNPLFLVKGIGEHHEMVISEAPVSFVDLQEAYGRLLEGKNSQEIFDYREGDQRERRYLYYLYEEEDHVYEYVTTGHASEDDKLIATGNEYIKGK